MKAWILGKSGMLGRSLVELCSQRNYSTVAFDRGEFDFEAPDWSKLKFEEGDVVMNAAAYTAVDLAESEPARARLVNATMPAEIAQRAHAAGAKFVYVSTDYAFDGQATAPYAPSHPRAPQNVYGHTKAEGEVLVQKAHPEALIVRTSWVFAPWGKNFVLTMADLLRTRSEVKVVCDQVGCPTFAPDLARALLDLTRHGAIGVYHFANGPAVSWFEFASAVQNAQGSSARVLPIPTSEFPRPAKRPGYSVLDVSDTVRLIGAPADFRAYLTACLP